MSTKGMNRRQFLQSSGLAAAGAAAIASGSVLMASDGAWALELGALDGETGLTLLKMTRRIYPHETLADMYYAGVVEALDAEAAGDAGTAELLKTGVAELDGAMGIKWTALSDGNQLKVLEAISSGPFFQKVRGKAVVALYNNPLVWRHFGYEGASADFGGYFERGFDDLTWLESPPAEASPAKAG